jgi:nucleotide-binding universal stress UspA family protein
MTDFKRILVPLDGSPLSERALGVAKSLARKFDSQLILLRSIDIPSVLIGMGEPGVGYWVLEAETELERDATEYLKAKVDELQQDGYRVHTRLCRQSPAQEIIDAAHEEKVDLVVMSTHGRGGVARWTFGSVADKVARHCPCPVLLVRENMVVEE